LAENSSQLAIPLSIRKRKADDSTVRISNEDLEHLEDLEKRRRDREDIYASKSKAIKSFHKSQATKAYNAKFKELFEKGLVVDADRFKERAGLPPASPVPTSQTSPDTLPGASSSPVVPASGNRNKKLRLSSPEEETSSPVVPTGGNRNNKLRLSSPEEETSSPRPGPSRKQPARVFKSNATVQESEDDEPLTPTGPASPEDPFRY
jgi:hypothetical protein